MMNRIKNGLAKALGIVFAILVVFFAAPADAVFADNSRDDITPLSKAAILYEETSDTVIYEKNKDMQLPPASMTKVMTAIIVLEDNPDLEGSLTVDPRAVKRYYCSWKDQDVHLEADEEISCYECMKFMLVFSANEATNAFAFSMYDDYGDFVDRMNKKAQELGCKNTHFSDTSGLSSTNLTTPEDMVIMCREAMKNEKFREIVRSEKGELPVSNKRTEPTPYNTFLKLKYPDERYKNPYSEYIIGIKTGWIPASGYCYSCCMEKDGYVYYSVVMGGEETEVNGQWVQGDFLDTLNLLKLTDDFKPPAFKPVTVIIAAVIAALALAAGLVLLKRRK
ncbi:MAG: serine hydrolase [Eubacteriaceae bacterium]|nr:serine hydrolase [Eubacteriaceae bacterium]